MFEGHTHTTTVVSGAGVTLYTVGGTAKCLDANDCGYFTLAIGPDSVAVEYFLLAGEGISLCCGDYDSPPGAATCPPPPPLASPPVAEVGSETGQNLGSASRAVVVPGCPDGWARVADFSVTDGSAPAGEEMTVWLCWTESGIIVRGEAADSEVFSAAVDCGSETWLGDSLEIFMSPALATPTGQRRS